MSKMNSLNMLDSSVFITTKKKKKNIIFMKNEEGSWAVNSPCHNKV